MKKMTKILALVLTLALVLSLGACSKKASVDGTWTYALDFEKAMTVASESEEANGTFEEFGDAFKGITVDVVLDLKADGTYTMGVSEESAKAAVPKMIDAMKAVLPDMLKELFGQGEDVDVNEMLEGMGMTMDDMLASFEEEMDVDEITKELTENTEKGTYTYADGKLNFTPENGEAYAWTVELNGTELKVTEIGSDADMNEALKTLLPLVFKK